MKKMTRGFTLIEVVLALALTVVVAGALSTTMYTAFRAKTSMDAAVTSIQAPALAGDAIAHELENAVTPTGILSGTFEGLPDDVIFPVSGSEPKAQTQGGIRQVEYCLVSDSNGKGSMLVRRVTTNLLADVVVTPPDEPLCHGVNSLQFSYWDGTQWLDSWDSTAQTNTLPVAMQIILELAPAKIGGDVRTTTRFVYFAAHLPTNQTAPVITQ